eukprot:15332856-Ditylum_brightwellii.AAC.2
MVLCLWHKLYKSTVKHDLQNSLSKQDCNTITIYYPDAWTDILTNPSISDTTTLLQDICTRAANTKCNICLHLNPGQCGVAAST